MTTLPFGGEGVDLVRVEVHLEAGEELVGVGHLPLPVDQLPDPGEALLVAGGDDGFAGLVFPVGGDSLFGDAMHLVGADLHLELVAALAHDGGVQGLVEVGAGDGDEVLDAAGDRTPQHVNEAEDAVAIGLGLGNDADGEEVEDLVDGDLRLLQLLEDGVEALDAPFDTGVDVVFAELLDDGVFDADEELFALDAAGFDGL